MHLVYRHAVVPHFPNGENRLYVVESTATTVHGTSNGATDQTEKLDMKEREEGGGG